ncbi:MAG: hypothetical protein V3V61_04560 [Gammaproteobacteria bacterium]
MNERHGPNKNAPFLGLFNKNGFPEPSAPPEAELDLEPAETTPSAKAAPS